MLSVHATGSSWSGEELINTNEKVYSFILITGIRDGSFMQREKKYMVRTPQGAPRSIKYLLPINNKTFEKEVQSTFRPLSIFSLRFFYVKSYIPIKKIPLSYFFLFFRRFHQEWISNQPTKTQKWSQKMWKSKTRKVRKETNVMKKVRRDKNVRLGRQKTRERGITETRG